MKKLSFLLLVLSTLNLVSCGGGGGGLSGSPDQPQTISVTLNTSSVTLDAGDTFQFHASVNNATDTTITWTVNDVVGGNSTVGTMSVDGLYTAPASVPSVTSVTAKAAANADKSKSATATITINPKFTISPTSATVAVGQSQQFTANLAVDNWQVNNIMWGSNTVGTITSSGLYTAPTSVPSPNPVVTVKVIKLGDATKTATATVTIALPGTPTISPTTATVPAGATQQFTANMAVKWDVIGAPATDPSTWGTISSAGLYTAPPSPPWTGKVNIKATSQSDSTKSANAVATVVFSNATLNGHYAFRYRSVDKGNPITEDPAHFWAIGSFVADGKGAISGGSIDLNEVNKGQTSAPFTAPFTGTYSISADGRASGTLTVQAPGGAESVPLRWVMISNTAARMIDFDDTGSGWGNIDMQDPSSFSAGLSGTYVFSYDGLNNALHPYAAAGMFNADAGGVISSGLGDFNDQLGVRQGISFDGGYTSIDLSTGRGTWNYTDSSTGYTWSFAYYLLNSYTFVFSSTDTGFGILGVAVQQDTSSAFSSNSLSGDSIFISSGYVLGNTNVVATWAGLLIADGNGKFSDGVVDNNVNGTVGANMPYHGAYSIDQNGHGTAIIANTTSVATNSLGLYMTAANSAFWVSLDPIWVATGQFNPQASGTYNTSTLHGSFAFTLRASYVSPADDMAGQMTSDGAGNLTGIADVNAAGTLEPNTPFTGTYTVSANGRGQVTITNGQFTANYAIYLLSGRTAFLVPIDPGAQATFGLAYRQF